MRNSTMNNLLLDTSTVTWMGTGESIREAAANQIMHPTVRVAKCAYLHFRPGELGTLISKEYVRLERSVLEWFEYFTTQDGIDVTALSPRILVNSWGLLGEPPKDPAD